MVVEEGIMNEWQQVVNPNFSRLQPCKKLTCCAGSTMIYEPILH